MSNYTDLERHLRSRHMYDYSFAYLDDVNGVVTFPLHNVMRQMVGYQQYRPHAPKTKSNDEERGRYYTFVGQGHQEVYWGAHTLRYQVSPVLFLTEGVFSAVRAHNHQRACLALFTCNPKPMKRTLYLMNRPTCALVEGDEGGRKMAKYAHYAHQLPEGKDLGDMSSDEVWKTLKEAEKNCLRLFTKR